MLSESQVKHIAFLARIGLSEDEVGKFQKDLDSVLGYVEKLKEVDVSGVEPVSYITGLKNEVREDSPDSEIMKSVHPDTGILKDMAPEKKNGYVKVEQILTRV